MSSPFPCSPVICEYLWKKTQIEKRKTKQNKSKQKEQKKRTFIFLCQRKRFVSSANSMGSNIIDAIHKSFAYIMNRRDVKIDPCDLGIR